MPQHYTLATVEDSIWCNACGKMTQWRVAERRRQYCIPCFKKSSGKKLEAAKPVDLQGRLFDGTER